MATTKAATGLKRGANDGGGSLRVSSCPLPESTPASRASKTDGKRWAQLKSGVWRLIQQNGGRNPPDLAMITERLELFEQFQPIEYLKGLGGNDHYIGAKYADDLVVFENMRHGNALYVLYDDWATLSQKPRSEILKLPTSKFDRIIHTEGWANRFAVLMQHELQARGTRIRIGRHQRRRQR